MAFHNTIGGCTFDSMARILVIDDTRPILEIMRRILTGAGHAVLATESATEGLRLWTEGGVDLVMTDLRLPEMNGVDLARRVRATAPEVPIILVSGEGVALSEALSSIGASGVYSVAKPFHAVDLLGVVNDALGARPPQGAARNDA